jgi:catechol 2,3-dioxygenase-like lactoylglutathione lyase family enzyme
MFKQLDYTMVIVSNMTRSIQFYRDKLGLELKMESSDWSEFQTGTTTLALHGGGIAQDRSKACEPGQSFAGSCSIGFNVEDVDKTFEDMKARGVFFVMPPTQREGEGIKLAVCIDPDGLPVSFAQLLH